MAHHSTRHKATPHWHISGSSRLRMDVPTYLFTPDAHTSLTETTRELGRKQYEISNHLGNVLSVITDQKLPVVDATVVVSYSAVVVTATDYSPFGVGLYGRSWSGEYRYGFQAQEQDRELWEGAVSFKYRVEDARLGRFFSVDPLFKQFPWNSVYAFSENSVIESLELEGLEKVNANEVGMRTRTRPWIGQLNYSYGFTEKSTAEAALRNGGYLGSGKSQFKYFFDPNATFHDGGKGAYLWERPTVTTVQVPVNVLVPTSPPFANPTMSTTNNFSFTPSTVGGVDATATAAIVAAIPPVGRVIFTPNGARAIPERVETSINGPENLPIETTTLTTNTPGTITTIGRSQVVVTLQTGWGNPGQAVGTSTAGAIMAQRRLFITNQLISQGVAASDISFNPDQYGALATGNNVQMQVNTDSTSQTGTRNIGTTTTKTYSYSE